MKGIFISIMLDNFYMYSDFSMRCIRRTTRGCRLYRLSLLGCRFCRSGSSGFVGRFRLLRWSSCVPVPRIRAYRTHFTSGLEVLYGLRGLLVNYSLILLIKKSNDEAIVVINPSGYKTQRELSSGLKHKNPESCRPIANIFLTIFSLK